MQLYLPRVQLNMKFWVPSGMFALYVPLSGKTPHWRRGGDILIETMTTLGSLTEFRPKTECFSAYLERARIFFAANDIAEEKQVPVFLNAIGASMYGLVRSLLAPTDPMTKSLKELTDVLSAHFAQLCVTSAKREDT